MNMGLIVRRWLAWMGGAAAVVVVFLLVARGWMVYGFMIALPASVVGVQRGLRADEKRQRSNGAPVA